MGSGWIDLHSHSTVSDGSLSPAELVRHGKKKGLAALALTDHDATGGLEEAAREGKALGLEVIPGVELAASLEGRDVHIIGLFIDPAHPEMKRRLALMAESRRDRNRKIAAKLRDMGACIRPEDLENGPGGTVTRGHIAKILLGLGYGEDIKDVMERYLSPGGPGYAAREKASPRDCAEAIRAAGGLSFVAHINQIGPGDPDRGLAVCQKALEAGADGLETLHSQYDAFWEAAAERLAVQNRALRSGGSDFHGALKPGLGLGDGYGNLRVPAAFLEAMKRERARRGMR
jgi:predicted metal-dependent phosphoesterase TrpH